MTRRPLFATLLVSLIAFCGCYTSIKQTRTLVSSDCSQWPAPKSEGSRLVLGLGEVGRFEDTSILFSELNHHRARRGGWYRSWPGVWGRPAYDVVFLTVCRAGEAPSDHRIYLSPDPGLRDEIVHVGNVRIVYEDLARLRPEAEADSTLKPYRITLSVSRESATEAG
jgi:hypothetical protein